MTAFNGLDHGTRWRRFTGSDECHENKRREKLLQYAARVWNIDTDQPDAADQAIARTEQFFNELGVKTRLSDYGVGIDTIDRIEKRFRERGDFALGGIDDVNV